MCRETSEMPSEWPPLPYDEWRETRDTLHMYTQVIGKLRLALSPFEPEWANVPLYVTARGLSTSTMPVGLRSIDAEFDLVDHVLVIRSSDGGVERRPLGGPVADFYHDVMRALERLDVDVAISVLPSEVANPIPFPDDRTHETYDAGHASRFHRVLSMVDLVTKEHHAGFWGRTTPVHFFWGAFDLALTRFSGKRLAPPPGAGIIERVGGDAEQICAGWWPGDERAHDAAFYAYAYPPTPGLEDKPVRPEAAAWDAGVGEFLLPYDAVRSQADPRQAILDFFRTTYDGAATLLGWDSDWTNVDAPRPRTGQAQPSIT
jgi:hypothetical protein